MLTLGIDTCCMASTAALVQGSRMVAQTVINQNKTHSQILMPQIEEMFRLTEVQPSEVELFSVAVGPGSFTGVRIGVATAKAMAQANNRPCVAVSTLEALAYSSGVFEGIVSPILDARRNQVYNGLFRCHEGKMERICPDRAISLEELLAELGKADEKVLFVGDGVFVFKERIEELLGQKAVFAPITTAMNLGGAVAALGQEKFEKGEFIHYSLLVPSYIRLSQAERDLIEKEEAERNSIGG